MPTLDVTIRTQAQLAAMLQAQRETDALKSKVQSLTRETAAHTAAAQAQATASGTQAGAASGLVGQLKSASEAYGKVLSIAARVSGAVVAITEAVRTGTEAWKTYQAVVAATSSTLSLGQSIDAFTAGLDGSISEYERAGKITNDQATAYRTQVQEALRLWRAQVFTVEDVWKRIHRISQELIRMNDTGDGPLLVGSIEDRLKSNLDTDQVGLAAIAAKHDLGRLQRNGLILENLQRQLKTVEELEATLLRRQPQPSLIGEVNGDLLKTEDTLQWEREFNEVLERRVQLEGQIREMRSNQSFSGQFRDGLQKLSEEYSDINRNLATASLNAIQLGVNGISDSIMGAITRTQTWGQVFLQVGRQIIASLVQVGVQMIAQFALAKLQAAITGPSIAASMTPAAAVSGAATFGANAVGVGLVVAAIAAGIASMAFAEGGLVPGAPSHRDNRIAHVAAGEFIHRTRAVQYYGPAVMEAINQMRIPRDVLASMTLPSARVGSTHFNSGGLVGATAPAAAAPAVNVAQPPIKVVIVDSRRRALEEIQSAEGRVIVQHLVHGSRTELGMTS